MQNLVPVLKISNPVESKAFYVEGLDFQVDWEWRSENDGSIFMQLSRSDIRLYLTDAMDSSPLGTLVYWYVDDVDQIHKALLSKSIGVDALPQNKPWGNREMQISDPDNNRLRVCMVL